VVALLFLLLETDFSELLSFNGFNAYKDFFEEGLNMSGTDVMGFISYVGLEPFSDINNEII